jgi:hypothetical protein
MDKIQTGLFDFSGITNLSDIFKQCTSLTNIPPNLFQNNQNITNLTDVFKNCVTVTPITKEELEEERYREKLRQRKLKIYKLKCNLDE